MYVWKGIWIWLWLWTVNQSLFDWLGYVWGIWWYEWWYEPKHRWHSYFIIKLAFLKHPLHSNSDLAHTARSIIYPFNKDHCKRVSHYSLQFWSYYMRWVHTHSITTPSTCENNTHCNQPKVVLEPEIHKAETGVGCMNKEGSLLFGLHCCSIM